MGDIVWLINPKKRQPNCLTRECGNMLKRSRTPRHGLEFNAPVVEPDLKLGANVDVTSI